MKSLVCSILIAGVVNLSAAPKDFVCSESDLKKNISGLGPLAYSGRGLIITDTVDVSEVDAFGYGSTTKRIFEHDLSSILETLDDVNICPYSQYTYNAYATIGPKSCYSLRKTIRAQVIVPIGKSQKNQLVKKYGKPLAAAGYKIEKVAYRQDNETTGYLKFAVSNTAYFKCDGSLIKKISLKEPYKEIKKTDSKTMEWAALKKIVTGQPIETQSY